MARIRTIKPEFFTSLTIADLTPEQRLTFIGLWTHVDDEGRCVDDARLIKAAVWPLDDRTAADIEQDLTALSESSLITRYILNRKPFLAVTSWTEHQRINRPTPSKLPPPDQGEPRPPSPPTSTNGDSLKTHTQLSEDSPPERNREQGTGNRETPLTPRSSEASRLPALTTPEKGLTDRMVTAWWDKYGRRTAQTRKTIHRAIDDALGNGIAPGELWSALERLGDLSKPVTGGTLQFALSDIRKPADVVHIRDRHQQATDDWFERAMARAQARDAQEGIQ